MHRLTGRFAIIAACMILLFAAAVVASDNDIARHRSCSSCGMDRKMYGYSRMLINYADGSQVGVCSLHCAVTEMNEHKGKEVRSLLVADRNSHELVPVEKAVWTVGGSKRGVMTGRAKWAFATREAADGFVAAYGGEIVSWETALAAARKDAEH